MMVAHNIVPLLLSAFFFLLSNVTALSRDSLLAGESINQTQTLVSGNAIFTLGFFSPGSSKNWYLGIWYTNITTQTVVWVANRAAPLTDSTGALAVLTTDGNLVVKNSTRHVVWSTSGDSNIRRPVARILDDGNLVVINSGGNYAWQSFEHPTDTMLPGMKIGSNLRTGVSTNLTSWRSEDDPAPGDYSLALDIRGDPQLLFYYGSNRRWRAGPWTGLSWNAIPQITDLGSSFSFSFIATKEEIYYSFEIKDKTLLWMLVVDQSTGKLVQYVRSFVPLWSAPKDQCDNFSRCGTYGVCNVAGKPDICSCMDGFEADRKGRCARKTALDCRNGSDVFVEMTGMKLPDTSGAVAEYGKGMEDCKADCMKNCSCTAYASANANGTGCLRWFGDLVDVRVLPEGDAQDFFVRVNIQEKSHKERPRVLIPIVIPIGAIWLVSLGCYFLWRRRNKRDEYNQNTAVTDDLELPILDFDTVAAATSNFSDENKLGEGGFGPVYKGTLGNGQEVAVKRLAKTSSQGINEFKNEVMLIAKLQHRNLVRLLACCIHGDERMLIYEYMPNKSLDGFLFDKTKSAPLDWQTRYLIITGIARGLLYLHQDSRFRIIHRDLKASNVLLDDNMNPKISDFGTARIFGADEIEANTVRVVGTYGYMSPEYALDGIFSIKSDVFSFGVLVLEIISGTKNRAVFHADPNQNLLRHAWKLWKEGQILKLIDPSMPHPFPTSEVLRCMKVGLLCVQEEPEDRLKMSTAVLMLDNDTASLPEPKQPGYVTVRKPYKTDSSPTNQKSCSVNQVSLSISEGR